jgi:hypothetical protein
MNQNQTNTAKPQKQFVVIILFLIFICAMMTPYTRDCFGQSITWQRIYDGPLNEDDIGYDICKADGGNFYIVGYANNSPNVLFIIKINEYGDTIWTRTVSDPYNRSIRALAVASSGEDGGCVLTGSWDSSFTIKYDISGNMVWKKFYGGHNILSYDILRTTNGCYIICGRSDFEGYILMIDSIGELVWQRTLTSMGYRYYNSIVEGIDDGIILSGYFSQTPTTIGDGLFTKIDSMGNIILENTFKVNGLNTGISNITKCNNSYFVSGQIQGFRVYSARLDLNGVILDTNVFFSTRNEYEPRLSRINSNKFVYTSIKDTIYPIPSYVLIRIIDSSFNIINQKTFSWVDGLTVKSIYPEVNGDILFAGWSKDYHPVRANVYALRTDSLLNAPPPIGINIESQYIPAEFELFSYPNPFNPAATIHFITPVKSFIAVKIYDITGREVTVIAEGEYERGNHKVTWLPVNNSSGIYFCTLYVGDILLSYRKIVYLK